MFKPLGNRIVVEPIYRDTDPSSVIVTPEQYRKDPQEFRVIAVGSGRLLKNGSREPIPIEPGWRVVSKTYNLGFAPKFEHEGRSLMLMDVEHVCFVLPP